MSCDKKNISGTRPVVRFMAVLWCALVTLLAAPAALAIDTGDIVVVSLKGEVHVTMNGAVRNVRAGGVLELPASIRTGRDGSIELSQGATSVNVGPETLLEFPALEKRGAPIDRIVQPRGNAFYSIGKREGRKLRVETPYLVGVIKGTQFNVAAQDESTTISLFEGLLEVRATDDSDVVDLKAGEIASRKRGDKSISVMKMDGAKAPPTGPRQPAGSGSNNGTPSPVVPRVTPSNEGGESLLVDHRGGPNPVVPGAVDTVNGSGAAVGASIGVAGGADVAVNAAANVGDVVDVRANAAVNAGAGGIDVAAGTRVDAGPVSVDAGAAVNLGGGSVDVSTSTNVSAGPVSVDTGAAVNLGGGTVDVSTSTGVNAGPVAVDVAGGAAVDVGAGTVDTAVSAAVDAGPLTTDVGASAAVDVGAGTVATGVDLGASAPVAVVDVGATAAVDVGAGTIDLGVTVAGTDLGLGVDLGLDDSKPSTDTTTTTTPVVDVGGLLDGLFHRRKK